MWYENSQKKAGAYLIMRESGTIAMRVRFNREKYEQALFKWPKQYWDEANRMFLPKGPADGEYRERLREAMRLIDEAEGIISLPDVGDIAAFKGKLLNAKTCPAISVYAASVDARGHARESSKEIYRSKISVIVLVIGDKQMSAVTCDDLRLIDAHYAESKKNATAVHAVFKKYFISAVRDGLLQISPYSKFKSNFSGKAKARREVPIEAADIEALWKAWGAEPEGPCRKAMQLFLIQAYTGARYSDANRIDRGHIAAGSYISKKTGAVCPIFSSDRLAELAKDGLPVGLSYHQYRYALRYISARLGISCRQSHDARRYFATALNEQAGDIMVVKQALGHSSVAMTEKYIKPNTSRLKDAVAKMGKM
jgi:integrase